MKPLAVRVQGFRRLADASTNISPRLLAVVGQNEAGKSSFLDALEWLTNGETLGLPYVNQARGNKYPNGPIVEVRYALDREDLRALADLELASQPREWTLAKYGDGRTDSAFVQPPGRDRAPFDRAAEALTRALGADGPDWGERDTQSSPVAMADEAMRLLSNEAEQWNPQSIADVRALCKWLEQPYGEHAESAEVEEVVRTHAVAAEQLRGVADRMESTHPEEEALSRLGTRVPIFAKFDDRYRDLPTATAFDGSGALIDPSESTKNMLRIAGVDLAAVQQLRLAGDNVAIGNLLREGNKRLKKFFRQSWNQSRVAIEFVERESTLNCMLYDLMRKRSTSLEERSDGLRAFLALAAFVESQELDIPPVLLIDEAETHLHIDAQADLVSVLQTSLNVTQVIYTTHSPGCLPSDLGTAIRLIETIPAGPGEEPTSHIVAHFWDNRGPGFSPLLYSMGAGAFAFSACRRAVIGEGASEMIMLPTMLRWATGRDDLGYQVAPGLSQTRGDDPALAEIAARVAFLVDGDGGGAAKARELVEEGGVPSRSVISWPADFALEDVLVPDYLWKVMQDLRAPGVAFPPPDELPGSGPIMKRLEDWAKAQTPKLDLIGKAALAYRVVEDITRAGVAAENDVFVPKARAVLVSLHDQIEVAFVNENDATAS